MIYFDNSATGGHKPYLAIKSAEYAINYLTANPGRSGHKLAQTAEEFVYNARKEICSTFGGDDLSRVIFTKNCTEALNLAILGTVKPGGHVVATVYEHNSVLRPLHHLKSIGKIDYSVVRPEKLEITLDDVKAYVRDNTYMVILNPVSNVTGQISEYEKIGDFCKEHNILLLIDGAQAGGHIPLDMKNGIDILCLAGHKGLNSIMGVGVLIFKKSVEISPIFFGGSGTETFLPVPTSYPEKLEAGTLNLPAICSLYEGIIYTKKNLSFFYKLLCDLTKYLIENLMRLPVKIYSEPNPAGIVAFKSEKIDSISISQILSEKYDIATRGGFHCAPLAHEFLGTEEDGLVRVSLCPQNTKFEINKLIFALKEILV